MHDDVVRKVLRAQGVTVTAKTQITVRRKHRALTRNKYLFIRKLELLFVSFNTKKYNFNEFF